MTKELPMSDEQKHKREISRQALIDIHHPAFRQGYHAGRRHYFLEPSRLTDKELVECLQAVFEQPEQEADDDSYHAIGQLVGQMSAGAIARQPHEDYTADLQEAFLTKITHEYGAAGQALLDTIRQFWDMQDQLAQMLDADTFELMVNRGVEKEI
jgi:hypothetical protein